MNYLSVCSGVEAASVAWKGLDWNPLGFSEIEKFPSEVLNHHYPNVPNLGDMTKYKEWNFGNRSVDLLVGGTPCQSFSVAGLRKGMEDPRGNLALTFCAILDKFRPKWFIFENVPGVLSSNKGRDFGSFLGAVAELRYGASYRVLDAQNFGVPQRRRRVFVVGHLGDWKPTAEVLFESESLRWHPKKSRQARKDSPGYIEGGFGAYNKSDVGGTIKASGGQLNGGSETLTHVADKAPTITSSAAGFSRPGNDTTADQQYIATAYNITFCDANGTRKDRPNGGLYVNKTNVSNTLTNAGVGTNVVAHAFEPGIAKRLSQVSSTEEKSPTLRANMGDNQVAVAHTFKIRGGCEGRGKGYLGQDEKAYTISTTQDQHLFNQVAVAKAPISWDSELNPNENKMGTLTRGGQGGRNDGVMQVNMSVRRLTPVECERLQGFPDNYTNIKENCPDGPRYKAMGNSMAVPVMKWIGTRINNYKEDTDAI